MFDTGVELCMDLRNYIYVQIKYRLTIIHTKVFKSYTHTYEKNFIAPLKHAFFKNFLQANNLKNC